MGYALVLVVASKPDSSPNTRESPVVLEMSKLDTRNTCFGGKNKVQEVLFRQHFCKHEFKSAVTSMSFSATTPQSSTTLQLYYVREWPTINIFRSQVDVRLKLEKVSEKKTNPSKKKFQKKGVPQEYRVLPVNLNFLRLMEELNPEPFDRRKF
jgi:uncharacterized membrane protein YcgQ (UPF0703/DUF1980 family)